MKIAFLLAFALTMLGIQAQDEVEFVVQKKQDVHSTAYLYSGISQNKLSKGSSTEYITVYHVADTFFYHYTSFNRDTLKQAIPYLAISYHTLHDTTYAEIRYRDTTEIRPMFIKGTKVLYNALSPYSFFDAPFTIGARIDNDAKLVMIDSNATIKVNDTTYQCIKLAAANEVPTDANYIRTKKGYVLKSNPDTYYATTIYYLRRSDYLPIRISVTEGVQKQFPSKSTFTIPDGAVWQLYKAIE